MMVRTPRFNYQRWGTGYVPVVVASLRRDDIVADRSVDFLLDTGSAFSWVRRSHVRRLIEGMNIPEQDTGARDANGNPMKGVPLEVKVRLVHARKFPEISERIWISSKAEFDLLGQTFLEKASAHFMNFVECRHGRHFSLQFSPYQDLGQTK